VTKPRPAHQSQSRKGAQLFSRPKGPKSQNLPLAMFQELYFSAPLAIALCSKRYISKRAKMICLCDTLFGNLISRSNWRQVYFAQRRNTHPTVSHCDGCASCSNYRYVDLRYMLVDVFLCVSEHNHNQGHANRNKPKHVNLTHASHVNLCVSPHLNQPHVHPKHQMQQGYVNDISHVNCSRVSFM